MKKIMAITIFGIAAVACGNNAATDKQTPTTIQDTGTQHPNGVTSDGVISTDTSAFGVNAAAGDTTKKKD
jgi:hypothetical protein